VRVITLTSRRIFAYREETGASALTVWLGRMGSSGADLGALNALFDIWLWSGYRGISASAEDLGGDLFALRLHRRGGLGLAPIFWVGPGDTEMTFLYGGVWENDEIRPYSAYGEALERLARLRQDMSRRVYERVREET
jgi:hypothetical protein